MRAIYGEARSEKMAFHINYRYVNFKNLLIRRRPMVPPERMNGCELVINVHRAQLCILRRILMLAETAYVDHMS